MESCFTVKEVAEIYKLSLSSIYRLAREDPCFPVINVGFKKKLVIPKIKFQDWIQHKNIKEEIIRLPSNTIVLRRRINEATKSERESITKW